jgi:hypothetical protein
VKVFHFIYLFTPHPQSSSVKLPGIELKVAAQAVHAPPFGPNKSALHEQFVMNADPGAEEAPVKQLLHTLAAAAEYVPA